MSKASQALPSGFRAATAKCNLKEQDREDVGLILSDYPCTLAALFTTNRFCAAPVKVCQQILASQKPVRAILANSGFANACTGDLGFKNVTICQDAVAKHFNCGASEVLPLSTGVIGVQLPIEKICAGMQQLQDSLGQRDALDFTHAMMTTDRFPKFISQDVELSTGKVHLTVMAKGAGMICPNMATMLCVCLTDVSIEPKLWQELFAKAVSLTFNRVTVDGDTSTNDTILGLANGASNFKLNTNADLEKFRDALTKSLSKVAHDLVCDGEGAHKVMHIRVIGGVDNRACELVARAVGHSQLVKTAIYGEDDNWGRIMTAIGYSGAEFWPKDVVLSVCGQERFKNNEPVQASNEASLKELLHKDEIEIEIRLGSGEGEYTLLASDLGHEYVELNSHYRS